MNPSPIIPITVTSRIVHRAQPTHTQVVVVQAFRIKWALTRRLPVGAWGLL